MPRQPNQLTARPGGQWKKSDPNQVKMGGSKAFSEFSSKGKRTIEFLFFLFCFSVFLVVFFCLEEGACAGQIDPLK